MWKFESGQLRTMASFLGNSEIKMAFITEISATGQSLVGCMKCDIVLVRV